MTEAPSRWNYLSHEIDKPSSDKAEKHTANIVKHSLNLILKVVRISPCQPESQSWGGSN